MISTASHGTDPQQPSMLSRGTLGVVAVALLSAAALTPLPSLSATAAVAGLGVLVLSLTAPYTRDNGGDIAAAGIAAVMLLLFARYSRVGPLPPSEAAVRPLWEGLVVLASASAVLAPRRRMLRRLAVTLAMLAVLVVAVAMTVSEWNSEVGFDVYIAHRAAASALTAGENPYGPSVQIPDGSPFAEPGDVFEGYPYPPVVLASYAGVAMAMDPRIVSLAIWVGVLTWLAVAALDRSDESDLALAVFVLMAAAPVWPVVWFASWSEPLSIGLFLLAALAWRKHPLVAGIALGLAVASKQYFIFLAPLLLLHRDLRSPRRTATVFGVAALTFLPALLVDPVAFWDATVENILSLGFRPDTQSLPGLLAANGVDFELSRWVWLMAGFSMAAVVGTRSKDRSDLLLHAALIMGFVFVTGLAFPNYWFLVAGLAGIGVVVKERDERVLVKT